VKDYYGVDPALGTLEDFIEFVHKAGERGIRVLIDLVMNHTSDQHPWFQAARRDKNSRYHDYYVWNDSPVTPKKETIFPGEENGVWTYDEMAGAYYHHLFYHFQPDLNFANVMVQEEVHRVLDFWLSFGIAGVRVDAAPHMIQPKGLRRTKPADPHGILKDLRHLASSRQDGAILIGESDVPPEELVEYFGDGDEFHMLFNFVLNNYLFLALARKDAEPLARVLRLLPSIHEVGQWANFLRNLDEADLEQLSDEEREEVFEAFAPSEHMRIFDRGIRRRIAPMLGDEQQRRLVFSLIFSLPGTPVIIYGDEYGLGEDLDAQGRYAVRAPMAWSAEENAGFSTAKPEKLIQPVISKGPFSYKKVNVAEQTAKKDSFLDAVREMIHVRKNCEEFGWGTWHILDITASSVFVHICEWKGSAILALHNLSEKVSSFDLDLAHHSATELECLIGGVEVEVKADSVFRIKIERFGYAWFRIKK
jgi:maltose alpha-D-glucosyltransferase/alpha-amylase